MFKGRSIETAVEKVHDFFLEVIAEGEKVTILQTDFSKADDFVNREVVLYILMKKEPLLKSSIWYRRFSFLSI